MRPFVPRLAVVLLLSLVAACTDDEPRTGSTTLAPSPTTTTTVGDTTSSTGPGAPEFADCGGDAPSPSSFDPDTGTYYVFLMGLDVEARSVAFDILQLLAGAAAADAYHLVFPEDPEGPPNGYWSVNESATVREAPVDPDVRVRLVRLHEDGNAEVNPGTFDELPAYLADYRLPEEPALSANAFWLTFRDGRVTEICEQYSP